MARCVRVCASRMRDATRKMDCIYKSFCRSAKIRDGDYEDDDEDAEEISESVPKSAENVPEISENVLKISENVPNMSESVPTTKVCKRCGQEKSLEEFNTNNHNKDGRDGVCKECRNAYLRRRRKEKKAEGAGQSWTKDVVIEVKDHDAFNLAHYTDQQLVAELRRRGIQVIAKKTVTVEL